MSEHDSYSEIADQQLDAVEASGDVDLYNALLDACDLIFSLTSYARQRSSAITTDEGIRFRLAVVGAYLYKVFWSEDQQGPRVEAVFPHP